MSLVQGSSSIKPLRVSPVKNISVNWPSIVFFLLLLFLVYQVVIPFAMIIWTSLKTSRPGQPDFLIFSFTLANYARAFGTGSFWTATWNTLLFAGAATVVSFVVGAFIAWVTERTNTPLAKLIGLALAGRTIVPGILIVISWILIASPNIGIANQIINQVFGVRNLINIYSFWGMVWVQSVEMIPLTFLLLSASFKAMDPRLEEASTMTGANHWRTFRRISLPLVLPAAGAALMLLFVNAIETFEVPLLMGGRAGIRVYSTEIYLNTSRTPIDWGLSATYAIGMLVLDIVLLFGYFRLVRNGERYQTITGKDFRPRVIELGRWRYPICIFALFIIFAITGLPLLIMIYASLLTTYQPPSAAAFQGMSLANYRSLLSGSSVITAMFNSTILGVATATALVIIVSLISYLVHKTRIRGRKALDVFAFAPIAIPSVVLGATFLWFYLLVPVPIVGTLTIIGLAYLTKYMPYALRFVSNSTMQIHSELDESAQVAGVPWIRNFFKVTLPLLKPGLLAAWFWVMVHAYRELTVALMLARSQNRTAAVIIYDLWETGSIVKLSAFGVLMFALLISLVLISHRVSKRYGIQDQYV
jgi:iron(III) transport system permease protein